MGTADAGRYSCVGRNGAGCARTEMLVEVARPPRRDEGPPRFLEARKKVRAVIDGYIAGQAELVLRAELTEGLEPIAIRSVPLWSLIDLTIGEK